MIRSVIFVSALAACSAGDQRPTQKTQAPHAIAPQVASRTGARSNPRLLRRFKAVRPVIAAETAPSAEQVELGRMLYFDPRLSRDRDVSCNSCHPLDRYGADGAATSTGHRGQRGHRNAPSVFHAAGHIAQFWDGRAFDVEAQATMPITNPKEMAMDGETVVERLRAVPQYADLFARAFPGDAPAVTFDRVGLAIAAFERGLVTPSRWDRFLGGDETALTDLEQAGFKAFTDSGCMVCHTGEFLGGSSFQKVGVVEPWPNQADQGRFEATGVVPHFSDQVRLAGTDLTGIFERGAAR